MTLFASVDADCDSEYLSVSLSSACDEVEGVCPSTCNDAAASIHTACTMNGATLDGEPANITTILLAINIFVTGTCKEVIIDKVLSPAATCQEFSMMNYKASALSCREDPQHPSEPCPKFCLDMMDGLYSTCSSDDTFVMVDEQGISRTLDVSTMTNEWHPSLAKEATIVQTDRPRPRYVSSILYNLSLFEL